ncbi:MAG: sulfur oxidation c-type cytochrome SoxA [Gammaproteobacteria bacterium]|nr:sulfur oxidation c-type cytochrome SoxA [Gammaproteobacteria bacterium]MCY4275877.1 sulfur oxidation c-type cytochrome SoxA [Gammaproteobacteria bacterium]
MKETYLNRTVIVGFQSARPMKRIIQVEIGFFLLIIAVFFAWVSSVLSQDNSIDEEVESFQAFFLERFYSVSLEEFNQGPYSLPQSASKESTFHFLEQLPPYMHALFPARSDWNRNYNGITLKNCMSQHPPANRFPYVLDDQIISVENAILACLKLQGRSSVKVGSSLLSALVAVFREQSRGSPIQIDWVNEKLKYMYQEGYRIFWGRRGQYNYSCASCHVSNAGNTMGNEVISAALGHTSAFPVYSQARLFQTGNGWITLHEQYQRCFSRTGAVAPPFGDQRLLALEIYQTLNDLSIPLNAPQSRL